MSHKNRIRERLFDAEPISTERRQQFREELTRIVEPPLSRGYRLYYFVALFGMLAGLPGAAIGLIFDSEHRALWGLFLLVCVVFAGWIVYILRRGTEPLGIMQGMSKAFAGMGAAAAGFVIFQGLHNPSLTGVFWALFGLLLFLLTSFINQWNRLITSENTLREQILRVEYRLAELCERGNRTTDIG